jgi:hypothetical protein
MTSIGGWWQLGAPYQLLLGQPPTYWPEGTVHDRVTTPVVARATVNVVPDFDLTVIE